MPTYPFQDFTLPLHKRLDDAWKIACTSSSAERKGSVAKEDKEAAYLFLLDVFGLDVTARDDPNQAFRTVAEHMIHRGLEVAKNPDSDYLPGNLQKNKDASAKATQVEPNITIKNGYLYQGKMPFVTSTSTMKNKETGAVPFICNHEGRITVFERGSGEEKEALEESRVLGVICAGALKTDAQGRLSTVNTVGGDIRPTFYNIYQFLQGLEKQGVNIKDVRLQTENEPPDGIKSTKITTIISSTPTGKEKKRTKQERFECKASDLCAYIAKDLDNALEHLKGYKSGNLFSGESELSRERQKIADNLSRDIAIILKSIHSGEALTPAELGAAITLMDVLITNAEEKNEALSKRKGKDATSGRLAERIRDMKAEIGALRDAEKSSKLADTKVKGEKGDAPTPRIDELKKPTR